MKADAWHRIWFNFGGIDREVTIRRLGASEVDVAVDRHPPAAPTRWSTSPSACATAPPRGLAVRGTLGRHGAALRAGQARRGRAPRSARACASPRPKLWAPGHPRSRRCASRSPARRSYARVGLRELRWAGGRLWLNGRPLVLRGASLQEDAPGRGDALTHADMDAIVARLHAIGANATRAQHPLNPALLERLDAAGILVWQGIGPVDSPGAWTSRTPARCAAGPAPRAPERRAGAPHPSVLAWNLANEVAGNGHEGGQAEYIDAAAQLVHRLDPGRPAAVDVWGTHMPERAGLHVPQRRRDRRHELRGLVRGHARPAGHGRTPPSTTGSRGCAPHSRARSSPSPSSARRRTALNAPRRPGLGLPGAAARPPHPHLRGEPVARRELVWNLQDFALAPSFAGGSIRRQVPEHRARARDQPEGPVHLRRPPEAGGRRGAPASRAERAASVVVRGVAALRGANCIIEGRK